MPATIWTSAVSWVPENGRRRAEGGSSAGGLQLPIAADAVGDEWGRECHGPGVLDVDKSDPPGSGIHH
jgi:hypothetical protein